MFAWCIAVRKIAMQDRQKQHTAINSNSLTFLSNDLGDVTMHEDILTPVWACHRCLQPCSLAQIYHKVLSAVTSCCMCAICRLITGAGAIHSTKWCGEINLAMKVISNSLEILKNLTAEWKTTSPFPLKPLLQCPWTSHLTVLVRVMLAIQKLKKLCLNRILSHFCECV